MDSDFLKNYWPYLLGAGVGLYVILKMTSSGGGSDYASYLGAQTQAAAINAQSNAELEKLKIIAESQARSDALESNKINAQAQVAYLNAQANMAESVGVAASEVAANLYAPSIAAINAATYENATAIQYAAAIAASAYAAQSDMVENTAKSGAIIADSFNRIWGDMAHGMYGAVSNAQMLEG